MKYGFIVVNYYIWQMVRINITPQTHVRTTQGDRIYFRIPREKLRKAGLARLVRIEKYNQYKIDLLALCKSKSFTLPSQGLCISYYIPVPKSWSEKKKKLYHGTLHQSTPDIDNLVKATFDSLVREDKYVGHIGSICKRWVNFPIGWIEFEVIEPILKEIGTNNECQLK
jgi:Holliday junction resolvase RusA-like endonuclease